MPGKKKATVVASSRGGIDSWDCSECGWFTHADAEMAAEHVESHNRAPKSTTEAPDEEEEVPA